MTGRELFEAWAPPDSVWSQWAKPALFAWESPLLPQSYGPDAIDLEPLVRACLEPGERGAVIIDLPGALSVRAGLELAEHGYRPVPMFNTTSESSALVDCRPILHALTEGAPTLAAYSIPQDAPPAFMLDSLRLTEGRSREPGAYDNRWVLFPQDFPSSTFLLSRGIRMVTLLTAGGAFALKDIDDVLARWQKGGLLIRAARAVPNATAEPYTPNRWWPLRLFTLMALFGLGLRRNSAGGFGSRIPHRSSGGYG
jgi:hypothetical protein